MSEELIDIFDKNNNLTEIRTTKQEAHKKGLWHRTAHIWVYNSKAEILLQLRSTNMDIFANTWDVSSAGHIKSGEEPISAAIQEMGEELGIDAKKEDLDFIKIRKQEMEFGDLINNEFYYVYYLRFDGDIENLKKQDEEVQEIKFIPIDKLKRDLEQNPDKYVPHEDGWVEAIEEVRKRTK